MMRVEYRGQNENISDYLGRRVMAIIKGTAAAYELEYRIVDYGEVPAVESDDEMMQR